jgi:hypothetical protein
LGLVSDWEGFLGSGEDDPLRKLRQAPRTLAVILFTSFKTRADLEDVLNQIGHTLSGIFKA